MKSYLEDFHIVILTGFSVMTKMNQKDMTLLLRLSQNSRISLTDLGKELNLTPAAIAYRINKLVEKKIIEKFTIIINTGLLTPNYQSYLIQAKVKSALINDTIARFQSLNIFDNILSVTANRNIVGITIPISSKGLGSLNRHLSDWELVDFIVTPVLDKFTGEEQKDITVEDVPAIYCLLCQETLGGDAVLSTIGDQTMAFCCLDCKEEFQIEYNKLIETSES